MTTPIQPTTPSTVPPCPPDEQLTAKLLGALNSAESAVVDAHLATCAVCREQAAELAKTVARLRHALAAPIVPEPVLVFSRERLALVKAAQVASRTAGLIPPPRSLLSKKRARQAPSTPKPPRAAWWCFLLPSAAGRKTPKKPVSVTQRIAEYGVIGLLLALLWGLALPSVMYSRGSARNMKMSETVAELQMENVSLKHAELKASDAIEPAQDEQAEVDGNAKLLEVADYSTPLKLPAIYSERFARGSGSIGGDKDDKADVAAAAAPALKLDRHELSRRRSAPKLSATFSDLRTNKPQDSEKPMEPEVGFVEGYEGQLAKGERAAQDADAPADLKNVSRALPDRQTERAKMAPAVPPPVLYEIRPFVATAQETFSTFGLDVDTASFTRARQALLAGVRPEPSSIRVEEFINAFDYDYAPPPAGNRFAIHAESAPSPFRPSLELLKIGIKGAQLGRDHQQSAMLTVVLDGSGSMNTPDRLGLARQALKLLVAKLRPDDRIALIQFNAQPRLLLEPTVAAEQEKILAAVDGLQAGGATHLENGLKLGYEVAQKGFVTGAANRVLLLSDGVANLGADDAQSLLAAVAENRKQGIYLSVFGLGEGVYNDALLEQLADKGDGTYVFLDSLAEAKRVLVDEFAASLFTIAKDVKIQVEFNPKRVVSWRQIGYDNRQLTKEQFRDDTVDAGEIGAGQAATALYELVLQGTAEEPVGVVRVRYYEVPGGMVREIQQTISGRERYTQVEQAPPRFRLAAGVAEFAELLRQSPYTQGSNPDDLVRLLAGVGLEQKLDRSIRDLNLVVKRAVRNPP